MIKLIASDMDGTLIRSDHKISEKIARLLKQRNKKGSSLSLLRGEAMKTRSHKCKLQGSSVIIWS